MCLIVFAWQMLPSTPLVAAANRDEFYDRPTALANWWDDHPHIYAGRDLQAGGTWMGVSRRDGLEDQVGQQSRNPIQCAR